MKNTNQVTCLLVDDDADDRDIFGMALSETGAEVKLITTENPEEALKLISRGEVPHVIFLDLNMPRMSGTQCLIEMKKISMLAQTPIVIYSTSSADRDREAALAAGAFSYFTKPSAINELTDKLKDLLSHQLSRIGFHRASA